MSVAPEGGTTATSRRARPRWQHSLRAGDGKAPLPLACPLVRFGGCCGHRKQPLCKRKKPRFPVGGEAEGWEGYLRHSAEGFPPSAPKQFGSRRTRSACQKRKTPQRGHSPAGSLRTPQLSSRGERQPGGSKAAVPC